MEIEGGALCRGQRTGGTAQSHEIKDSQILVLCRKDS